MGLKRVNKCFIKLPIIHFAGTGSKAGTMFIKVNKSFIKLLIMHFAGTGSKAGTMVIEVKKSFNILLYVIKVNGKIKNTYTVNTIVLR